MPHSSVALAFFVGGARPSHSLVVPFYMFYAHVNVGGQRSVVAMRRLQMPLGSVATALGIGGNDGALPSTVAMRRLQLPLGSVATTERCTPPLPCVGGNYL